MFKITCPYCHRRIPISSIRCPDCRTIIPHECGDDERGRIFFWALSAGAFLLILLFVGIIALMLWWFG